MFLNAQQSLQENAEYTLTILFSFSYPKRRDLFYTVHDCNSDVTFNNALCCTIFRLRWCLSENNTLVGISIQRCYLMNSEKKTGRKKSYEMKISMINLIQIVRIWADLVHRKVERRHPSESFRPKSSGTKSFSINGKVHHNVITKQFSDFAWSRGRTIDNFGFGNGMAERRY